MTVNTVITEKAVRYESSGFFSNRFFVDKSNWRNFVYSGIEYIRLVYVRQDFLDVTFALGKHSSFILFLDIFAHCNISIYLFLASFNFLEFFHLFELNL